MGTPHSNRWIPAGTLGDEKYYYYACVHVYMWVHEIKDIKLYLLGVLYQLNNLPSINDWCRTKVIWRGERE